MKLTFFRSGDGDCFLVTSADGKRNVLVDGGREKPFRDHVAPALAKLKKLDRVMVSHIDNDHISGVLALLDLAVEWKVFEHQNGRVAKPKAPRPPAVGALWHNGFAEQAADNNREIADLLSQMTSTLAMATTPIAWARSMGGRVVPDPRAAGLATGVKQALALSHRLDERQLDIDLNPENDGKLLIARRNAPPLTVGSLRFRVIGPFQSDLDNLRKEWNAFLKKNKKVVSELRTTARRDGERIGADVIAEAESRANLLAEKLRALGARSAVTVPNLASLMFLLTEGDKTALLTGDGHADDIIRGLTTIGALEGGKLHVNVLKAQHHGAAFNFTKAFAENITADDYVFCGNGAHHNPDAQVVRLILDARLGGRGPKRKFRLWFNSSPRVTESKVGKKHLEKIEKLLQSRHDPKRFSFTFLEKSSFALNV